MSKVQDKYNMSERLIRAISNWQVIAGVDDDVEELLEAGAEVNQSHGTLLPLHCACMVSDVYCLRLLIEKGADVSTCSVLLGLLLSYLMSCKAARPLKLDDKVLVSARMRFWPLIKKGHRYCHPTSVNTLHNNASHIAAFVNNFYHMEFWSFYW
jgi:ankyrin repeat protein